MDDNNPKIIQKNDFIIYKYNNKVVIKDDDGEMEGFVKNQHKIEEMKLKTKLQMIILSALSLTYFNTDLTIVNGISMEPTYRNYQVLLKTRYSKKLIDDMLDKDVIVKFKDPNGDVCIKRIVACPGDKLEFNGSVIKVNGKIIDTDNRINNMKRLKTLAKIGKGHSLPTEELVLKHNQYFVVGDNRIFSVDSRDFGPITADSIINIIRK